MKTKFTLFAIIAILGFGACVRDGASDCPQGKYLYFETIIPKYEYEDIADRLEIFVYDDDYELVHNSLYSQSDLRLMNYRAFIGTPLEGEFTVVAHVNFNDRDEYLISGKDDFRTLHASLLPNSGDTVKVVQADTYHITERVRFDRIERPYIPTDTLPLSKNTNVVNLTIVCDGFTLPDGHNVSSVLAGNNGEYNYYEAKSEAFRVYMPVSFTRSDGNDQFAYTFSTMRLAVGDDMTITMRIRDDDGNLIKEQDVRLSDQIVKIKDNAGNFLYDTDDKLELEDIFEITALLDNDYTIVSLVINDWQVIKNGFDL